MGKSKKQKKSSKKQSIRTVYRDRLSEADGTYFLKLVVVVLLGTFWLKFKDPIVWNGMPIGAFPLGALLGLIGIHLAEKNPVDRKIWFAVILIVMIVCYYVPAGIVI